MKRILVTMVAVAAAAVLSGCAPMFTQSPGEGLSPVNAVADGEDRHLILFGHDVVSYFTAGRHQMGSPAHRSVHKGVTFRFASAENKKLFDASPGKYLPQYGGYCANGIVYGIPWGGDADTWRIIDGKLYIFGGAGSRDAFLVDTARNLALAEKYWNEEVNGANAFWQRAKRLVLRVPHYKSGQELADAVAKSKAAGK